MSKVLRMYSCNLLGDQMLQTPAIRSWKNQNPDGVIKFYCHIEHGSHVLLRHNKYIDEFDFGGDIVSCFSAEAPIINMRADTAFSLGASNGKSLAWGYGQMLGVEIDSHKYDYSISFEETYWAADMVSKLQEGSNNPVVLIARHSASCTSNDPRVRVPNKCVPNRTWVQAANWLLGEGFIPVAIGSKKDVEDTRYREWPGKTLYGESIRNIAALTRYVKAVLSVDCGIRHITAAAGGNLFCLSGRIPLSLIHCEPIIEEQKIFEVYRELPFVNAGLLIDGAQKVL